MMNKMARMIREAKEQGSPQRKPYRRIEGIKTTPPFTAFLANNYGRGRVGRHSMMSGRTAIVPDGFEVEAGREEIMAQQLPQEPVGRSVVSDGAGIFNTEFLKMR